MKIIDGYTTTSAIILRGPCDYFVGLYAAAQRTSKALDGQMALCQTLHCPGLGSWSGSWPQIALPGKYRGIGIRQSDPDLGLIYFSTEIRP